MRITRMFRHRGALLAALLLALVTAGCGGDTGLLITVELQSGVSADQLLLSFTLDGAPQAEGTQSVPDPPAAVAQTSRVLVLVPDAWQGKTVAVQVQALVDQTSVGQGSAEVALKNGEVLEVTVKVTCQACGGPDCGNGKLDPGEKCDTKIAAGKAGACPKACDDKLACTKDTLQNGGTCGAVCSHSTITACTGGDGCCPTGCNAKNDSDCSDSCGNGVVEPPEKCDTAIAAGKAGACPKACDDQKACTENKLLSAGTCSAVCSYPAITQCKTGDGCCPTGCTSQNDGECAAKCGNAVKESGEACDTAIAQGKPGACPKACSDGKACTSDALKNPGTCAARCVYTNITTCKGGDGCCPSGCSSQNDSDCTGPVTGWLLDLSTTESASVQAVDLDSKGNIYIAGYLRSDVNVGNTKLTAAAETDIFVAKLDHTGKTLWATAGGGSGYDLAYGIAVDGQDEAVVVGRCSQPCTLGSTTLPSGDKLFMAKLNSSTGGFKWVQSANPGTWSVYDCNGVDIDSQNNIYVTGVYRGAASFGTSQFNAKQSTESFVAKLSPAGNYGWVVSSDSTNGTTAQDIAVDSAGNAVITGEFGGTTTFGSKTITAAQAAGHSDVFVARLNKSGAFQWASRAGSSWAYTDVGDAVVLDSAGNAYVTGMFNDDAKFGSRTLRTSGVYDMFIAKLSPSGAFLWTKQGGGNGMDRGYGIAIDGSNTLYVTGRIRGTSGATFGSQQVTVHDDDDVFATRLSSSGTFNWAVSAGGVGGDYYEGGNGIAVDSGGNIVVVGAYSGSATFGSKSLTHKGTGKASGFVWLIPKP